jgi:UDP:flavonoid glycosyltransferase YjiC (YdhE family)
MTHGGHGTAMRALMHGVPMVVVPGLAGDQPFVAAAIQEFGVGLALPGDADTAAMRAACQEVLANPSYRLEAQRRAKALANGQGAAVAARAVETLFGATKRAHATAAE